MYRKSISFVFMIAHAASINFGTAHGETYTLDTWTDLVDGWTVNCDPQGYYNDEDSICGTEHDALIPHGKYRFNKGFWTPCYGGAGLGECALTLNSGTELEITKVGIFAYMEDAEVTVTVTSIDGRVNNFSIKADEWTDLNNFTDVSSFFPIQEIQFVSVYNNRTSFTVLDKILLTDDNASPSTTEEPSTESSTTDDSSISTHTSIDTTEYSEDPSSSSVTDETTPYVTDDPTLFTTDPAESTGTSFSSAITSTSEQTTHTESETTDTEPSSSTIPSSSSTTDETTPDVTDDPTSFTTDPTESTGSSSFSSAITSTSEQTTHTESETTDTEPSSSTIPSSSSTTDETTPDETDDPTSFTTDPTESTGSSPSSSAITSISEQTTPTMTESTESSPPTVTLPTTLTSARTTPTVTRTTLSSPPTESSSPTVTLPTTLTSARTTATVTRTTLSSPSTNPSSTTRIPTTTISYVPLNEKKRNIPILWISLGVGALVLLLFILGIIICMRRYAVRKNARKIKERPLVESQSEDSSPYQFKHVPNSRMYPSSSPSPQTLEPGLSFKTIPHNLNNNAPMTRINELNVDPTSLKLSPSKPSNDNNDGNFQGSKIIQNPNFSRADYSTDYGYGVGQRYFPRLTEKPN